MKRTTRILLAAGLILAVATPALAEFKLNGYYRLMGIYTELRSGGAFTAHGAGQASTSGDEEGDSRSIIDQRFRAMMTYSLNDNVALVYQAEIDSVWGAAAGGNGAQLAADAINVETKNMYLDLKSGDTSARLGVQGIADAFQNVVFNDDMAGLTVNHKMGATTVNALYAKLWEDSRSDYDDTDLYGVAVSQKLGDAAKVGAALYFLDINDVNAMVNNANQDYQTPLTYPLGGVNLFPGALVDDQFTADVYVLGVNGDVKFGNIGLDGFVVYQDINLDYNPTAPGVADESSDGDAWMATGKATVKLDGGDVGLRLLYVSPNKDDNDYADQWIGNLGQYEFANENLMQFMVDKFVCNIGKERYAFNDAVFNGFGLWGLMASGNHTLPESMYVNWGAGYFRAATDDAGDDNFNGGWSGTELNKEANGKTLGYEVALRVGKKYFEKVDVSLNASYASYGNFYDDTTVDSNGQADDPDNTYKTYLMVNVPF